MKFTRILIVFVALLLVFGIAFFVYSVHSRLTNSEYQFQVDAVLTAASIANGPDPLTADPAMSVIAEYDGRRAVVVPGNYQALSAYLRKDSACLFLTSLNRENAMKITVCDIATFYLTPQGGSEDVVLVELVTKDRTFRVRTDGGNQWRSLLDCCLKGTYHDQNILLE